MVARMARIHVLTLAVLVGCSTNDGGDPGGSDTPSADDVRAWIIAYKAAHPGSDGDINAKTDGAGAGLSLAEASTDLRLVLADGSTVHLYTGL
jgi:hypothetical protein